MTLYNVVRLLLIAALDLGQWLSVRQKLTISEDNHVPILEMISKMNMTSKEDYLHYEDDLKN